MKSFSLRSIDNESDSYSARGPGRGEPADHCSREGAQDLKQKIEAYWRERGFSVMVLLHNVGFHPAIRAARYDVRSDMINGMPRRPKAAAPPPPAEAFVEDFDVEDDDLSFE